MTPGFWLLYHAKRGMSSADSVLNYVGEGRGLQKRGSGIILIVEKSETGDHRADEHDRTRSHFCPTVEGARCAVDMGLAALSALRERLDDQERELPAQAMDF